tara:strand:+ start:246 stop:503 length:258 start_codon:yes stop_codon:yes gene_type:complete
VEITRKQIRRIIKEEKARLLSEQAGDTEALIIVDAIQYAVFDSIVDELKLKPEELVPVRDLLLSKQAEITVAIENAFEDAMRGTR